MIPPRMRGQEASSRINSLPDLSPMAPPTPPPEGASSDRIATTIDGVPDGEDSSTAWTLDAATSVQLVPASESIFAIMQPQDQILLRERIQSLHADLADVCKPSGGEIARGLSSAAGDSSGMATGTAVNGSSGGFDGGDGDDEGDIISGEQQSVVGGGLAADGEGGAEPGPEEFEQTAGGSGLRPSDFSERGNVSRDTLAQRVPVAARKL